ncbi:MAG: hypothetical protein NZ901_08180 [Geminocystis sp.]|nr:hypothetical protein [Geminocystis sp.]HIK38118.1 hypothetical protein [Geminocystis sp. M7585_C2015_104]MCS7148150.1 hypothetical protein [Geminocystis sp.]MCX8078103.1 hypothetical protein [Geminocystis sp.]MDW8116501.1 hypothetical protein [Geminocystis sp.]
MWGTGGGDRAHVNHEMEDELMSELMRKGIRLSLVRRSRDKRNEGEHVESYKRRHGTMAGLSYSIVERYIGKRPFAVDVERLLIRVYLSVLSYNTYRLYLPMMGWG